SPPPRPRPAPEPEGCAPRRAAARTTPPPGAAATDGPPGRPEAGAAADVRDGAQTARTAPASPATAIASAAGGHGAVCVSVERRPPLDVLRCPRCGEPPVLRHPLRYVLPAVLPATGGRGMSNVETFGQRLR